MKKRIKIEKITRKEKKGGGSENHQNEGKQEKERRISDRRMFSQVEGRLRNA